MKVPITQVIAIQAPDTVLSPDERESQRARDLVEVEAKE